MKLFLFLAGFCIGIIMSDAIDTSNCINHGVFYSYFNGTFTCEEK